MFPTPLRSAVVLAGLAIWPAATHATDQERTWNGSGANDLWTTGANWVEGSAPNFDLESCDLLFGATGADQSPDAGSDDYFNIGNLSFTNAADAELTLIGSGSLSFDSDAVILNDSTFEQTIGIDIIANGATLILDAAMADLTISGAIDLSDATDMDGVTLRVMGNETVNIRGAISGEDGKVELVSGTLVLSRPNSYGGGTDLQGGTLVVGRNSALGTGDVTVSGDANIESDNADRAIGNDVGIDAAATLTFSGDNSMELRGVISGEGALAVNTTNPNARLILNGENTYTGDTTLTSGAIVLGSDTALGEEGMLIVDGSGGLRSTNDDRVMTNDVFIDAGGELTFEGPSNLTLDGEITGTGDLRKNDTAILMLTADSSSYTGTIRIFAGEIAFDDAAVGGGVLINDGGTFSGFGSVGGDIAVNDGGTLRVSNADGPLEVGGVYTQSADATLFVELSADDLSSSMLDVAGPVSLDGTIDVSVSGDGYIPSETDFLIFDAPTIHDFGAEIITSSATVTVALDRDLDFVQDGTTYALELTRAADAYSNAANAGNNRSIGLALNSLIDIADMDPSGRAGRLLGELDTFDSKDYNQAVSELSPEPYTALNQTMIDNSRIFAIDQSIALSSRRTGVGEAIRALHQVGPRPGSLTYASDDPTMLAAAFAQAEAADTTPTEVPDDKRWSNYAQLQVVFANQDTTSSRTGFDANLYGGQVGVDYAFSDSLIGGVALGLNWTDATLNEGLGDLKDGSIRLGPYGSWTEKNVFVDGSLTFGYHFYEGDRNIPSLGQTAASDYNGWDVNAYVGSGYHWEVSRGVFLTPTGSLLYAYYNIDSFTESGSAGALTLPERNVDSLRSRLGANLSLRLDYDWKIIPYVFAGWEHEYLNNDDTVQARFASGGNPFTINVGSLGTDSVFIGGGFNVLLDYNMSMYLRYEGNFSSDGDVSGIGAGLSISF